MKYHDERGGFITFRVAIGNGKYKGHKFELAVSRGVDGTILGMPVVTWDDGSTVTFELDDVIPHAFNYAVNHGGLRGASYEQD